MSSFPMAVLISVRISDSHLKTGIKWKLGHLASRHTFTISLVQWGSEIRKHLISRLFEGWISNGPVFKWSGFMYGYSYSPNVSKTGPFKICTFLSLFQMVFDRMSPFCPDFKLLGFRISDPIQNLDHPLFDFSKS